MNFPPPNFDGGKIKYTSFHDFLVLELLVISRRRKNIAKNWLSSLALALVIMAVARLILRALVHRVHPPGQPRRMEDGDGEGKERYRSRCQGCELPTTLQGRRPGLEVPGWRVGGAWRSRHPHDNEGQVRQRTASFHFATY